jgi:hypothetical protein
MSIRATPGLAGLLQCVVALEVIVDEAPGKRHNNVVSWKGVVGDAAFTQSYLSNFLGQQARVEVGSGLLLSDRGHYILATARHVVEDLANQQSLVRLVISRREGFDPGPGGISLAVIIHTFDLGASGELDHDLALILVPPGVSEALESAGYRGYPSEWIADSSPAPRTRVVAAHFPEASRTAGSPNPRGQLVAGKVIPDIAVRESDYVQSPRTTKGRIVAKRHPEFPEYSEAAIRVFPGSSGAPIMSVRDKTIVGLVMGALPDMVDHAGTPTHTFVTSPTRLRRLLFETTGHLPPERGRLHRRLASAVVRWWHRLAGRSA